MLGVTRLCLLGWVVGLALAQDPEARTTLGRLRGLWRHTPKGTWYAAFNGVPYALPPIGQLRFHEPVDMGPYSGVLDATRDSDDCAQFDNSFNQYPNDLSQPRGVIGSEDCLYLNIYTPQKAMRGEKKLPVMVFIHGGAFMVGSGATNLHGPQRLMDREVVLVIINYRLGVLGFLRLDNQLVTGNLGLKDQVAALKWVNKNIASFGGDPESVTIFGESAGGASTHLLMHVPSAQGLFQKVISQSGTGDAPWALLSQSEAAVSSEKLLTELGCKGEVIASLNCLRTKSPADIIYAATKLKTWGADIIFGPVVEPEGGFLSKSSLDQRSSLAWMTGANSAEGYIIIAALAGGGNELLEILNNYRDILPKLLKYSSAPDKDAISDRIKEKFLGQRNVSWDSAREVIKMLGEGMFNHPMEVSAKKHKGPVYRYYFSYVGKYTFSLLPGQAAPPLLGASHADDLIYLLNMDKIFPNSKFNLQDAKVSQLMLDMWTDFANYGKPKADWSSNEMREVTSSGDLVTVYEEPNKLEHQLWATVDEARRQKVKDEL